MGESGAGSADSYIGSLISLTSKSEIRYEGLLYIVDTENSNIALQNVRSFGTEGRKKDGPQIPASDKVYDYIVFRGTDIKDLQVKSSPPAQQPNDPAIISLQSQRSQPAPVSPALIPPAAGPSTDASPSLYSGPQSSPFQMSLPSLYQPTGAGVGSWGLPPPPLGANGTGLLMPMYWSGLYRPLAGHASSHHYPFTPHPTPSLPPLPPRPLQAEQQPAIPSSLSTVVTLPSSFIPSKQPTVSGGSSAASLITPATFSAAMSAPEIVSVQASAVSVTVSSPPQVSVSTTFPSVMHYPSSVQGVSAVITPAAKTSRKPSPPVHSQPQIQSQIVGSAAAPMVSTTQSVPLTTVGSVSKLQSGAQSSKVASVSGKDSTLHMQSAKPGQVSAGILKTVSEPLIPAVHEAKQQQLPLLTQPLLPLPVSSTQHKSFIQGNGSLGISSYIRRGRGRGSGTGKAIKAAHPKQQFLEEFDFTAMNEKFKKDEVWGELGKGESREKGIDNAREGLANASVENDTLDKSLSIPEFPKKPVYVKDDFFDSLSCDALDREGGRSERMKHSEQRKIDTETFGVLPSRPRGSRGGRGGSRGGRGGYRSGFQVARNFSGGRANGPTRQGRGSARATSSVV